MWGLPGGEQGDSLVGWQSGVVASLADPKDGGNGMPNPARLMGTRKRTDADGSQESQREKRDRTSAAWQSRAKLQSGVGWKWCHFPDVRGSPRREGGREAERERRQKVLRRLFRRMSYERGTERGGRGEGRSRGFCVLISQEPTWPLGRSLVGDGTEQRRRQEARKDAASQDRGGAAPTRTCHPITRCDVACRPSSSQTYLVA